MRQHMKKKSSARKEEFAEQLPQRFDIVAFADYLAVHNLLANNDSLPGMGNNYYLYYDFDTEMFTILSWDTNESLGKLAMGGGSELDIYWESIGDRFGGMFDAVRQTEETTGENADDSHFGGLMGRGNHLLKERFLATPEFRALYEERYQLLYEQIYVNDLLTPKIEEFAALVTEYNAEHDLVDQAEYGAAVEDVLKFVTQRYDFLSATELLGE
jgi:spore coat protein CotH